MTMLVEVVARKMTPKSVAARIDQAPILLELKCQSHFLDNLVYFSHLVTSFFSTLSIMFMTLGLILFFMPWKRSARFFNVDLHSVIF